MFARPRRCCGPGSGATSGAADGTRRNRSPTRPERPGAATRTPWTTVFATPYKSAAWMTLDVFLRRRLARLDGVGGRGHEGTRELVDPKVAKRLIEGLMDDGRNRNQLENPAARLCPHSSTVPTNSMTWGANCRRERPRWSVSTPSGMNFLGAAPK